VKGGEAGTEWSDSDMEYGSEANPGTSPTAKETLISTSLLPECPNKKEKKATIL